MSLGRVKTWGNEVLNYADLNGEFNNILNNPTLLISPATADWDLASHTLIDAVFKNTPVTFASGDATPSVAGGTVFKTANAAPTTISFFNNGIAGQRIWVVINDANTIVDFTGTNLSGNAGFDWYPSVGDILHAVFITPKWYCVLSSESTVQCENLLPNTNWQLMSTNAAPQTKMNVEGTGTESPVSFSSFTASSNTPTFLTTNTQRLNVGDRVYINGLGNLSVSGMIVTAVTTNTSFTLALPLGLLSPASSTGSAIPIGNGDSLGNTTGASGVGWNKTVTLISWADDFSVNRATGAKRVMGFRKAVAGVETHYWNNSTRNGTDMSQFVGRTVTFGAVVRQKVKGGAGTFRLQINDTVSTTSSASGTGSGSYEFLTVTKTISANATDLLAIVSFEGTTGDVYYLGLPTLIFGSALPQTQLGPPPNEMLFAGHWNPPILTPLAMTFPATAYPGTGGLLFGFSGEDIEALSYGVAHHTIKAARCKIELTTPVAGRMLLTGSEIGTNAQLVFGPQQVTQVGGVVNVACGVLSFAPNGKFALFTAAANTVITNATFDFDVVYL